MWSDNSSNLHPGCLINIVLSGIAFFLVPHFLYHGAKGFRISPLESENFISGVVIDEKYIPSDKSAGLNSKYILGMRTNSGLNLDVSVIDGPDRSKEDLDIILGTGSGVCFPRGNTDENSDELRPYSEFRDEYRSMKEVREACDAYNDAITKIPGETCFTPETQAGNKRADRIRVLD